MSIPNKKQPCLLEFGLGYQTFLVRHIGSVASIQTIATRLNPIVLKVFSG